MFFHLLVHKICGDPIDHLREGRQHLKALEVVSCSFTAQKGTTHKCQYQGHDLERKFGKRKGNASLTEKLWSKLKFLEPQYAFRMQSARQPSRKTSVGCNSFILLAANTGRSHPRYLCVCVCIRISEKPRWPAKALLRSKPHGSYVILSQPLADNPPFRASRV